MINFFIIAGIGLFCLLAAVAIHHARMPHPLDDAKTKTTAATRRGPDTLIAGGAARLDELSQAAGMPQGTPPPEKHLLPLIDVGLLLYQEVCGFVDDAVRASDNPQALACSQDLLAAWEEAYKTAGLNENDHFIRERQAALRMAERVKNHPLADRYQSAEPTR